jgi:two-component system NtrC family response regulator
MNNVIGKPHLLVIEDDEGLQRQLRWSFSDYDVHFAENKTDAITALRRYQPEVVTLDLGLPPDPANVSVGFETLEAILSLAPDTKVLVITGNDDRENALKAIGLGAYDFYQKPIDLDIIKIIINRAFRLNQLEKENRQLQKKISQSPLEGLLTNDAEMLKICRMIEKIAPTDTSTLLIGESGTGKEILARALHELSGRSDNKFVAINCAAIPENLLESELFGYEKGAFTGANKQTLGKLELANGGTLFLDEIGDLPMGLQAKLLRFLQERVIERVGGRKEIPIDIRVVCATHRNINEMVENNQFREDLYYRLSEISIKIPPLSARTGDAILIARKFLQDYCAIHNPKVKGFTKDAIQAIEKYGWPGNVRELENKVKRAVIMAESPYVSQHELDLDDPSQAELSINLKYIREQAELNAITRALNASGNNIKVAADILGITRPTLYDLMKKLNIGKKDK